MTPCWEVSERWPKFCASLANGRKRCRKGTCYLVEIRRSRDTGADPSGPETATQGTLL